MRIAAGAKLGLFIAHGWSYFKFSDLWTQDREYYDRSGCAGDPEPEHWNWSIKRDDIEAVIYGGSAGQLKLHMVMIEEEAGRAAISAWLVIYVCL